MHSILSRRHLMIGAGSLTLAAGRPTIAQTSSTLRVVSPWEYTSDDPADTGYIHTRIGVAETLVGVTPDGKLVGLVAESWACDPDRLTWRFPIRPGLHFHDGSPVTANAVAGSLRTAFVGESLSNVPLDTVGVQDNAVLIRTKTPFAPLPAFFVDYAGIILAPAAYGSNGKVRSIIATGPYRLVRTDGRSEIDAERFDGYWGQKPAVSQLRYLAVPNGDSRANIAIAGDADLVFTLAPQAVPRIDASGQAKVISLIIPRLRFITLNCGLPQFSDPHVRRALSLAIDRAGIAVGILRDPQSAATQLLPPILSQWYNPDLPPLRTDPNAARTMLEEAGWIPGADGIRVKDGVRLAATVLVPSNRPEMPVIATAVQEQLRAVGMDMKIDAGQFSALPEAMRNGTLQMGMIARTYVNVPDPIATIIPDYTRERSVWGTLNWGGRSRMKALTDAYVQDFDDTSLARLRRDITRLIHDEMPVIPISWFQHTVAVSSRTHGVIVDPFEMRYYVDRVTLS